MIGSGSSSQEDAITLTKFSAKIGAKASLLIPPFYFKNVTDDGVIAYYRNVIESAGDNEFKFLLYNIPQHSGVTINFNIIKNLLKLYPNNVVGLKDSTGNMENMLKTIKYFNNFVVICTSNYNKMVTFIGKTLSILCSYLQLSSVQSPN